MQRPSQAHSVRLLIAKDGTSAELVLPPDADREHLAFEWCVVMLQEASIEITDDVRRRLSALLESYVPGEEARATVAAGTSPKHGRDGYIEWHEGFEPGKLGDEPASADVGCSSSSAPPDPRSAVCYYSRSAFTMVKAGQRLGRIVEPVPGKDGRDVRGMMIPAREGRAQRLKLDDSIDLSADGVLTARRDGVLSRSGIRLCVHEFLEVSGNVDFSTGNIRFDGDAKIRKGIRDRFEVRVGGNLEVGDLIEAATIEVGGDIFATGGMAGRERGSIRSKGDTVIRYLDSCRVDIGGTLRFEREMINCQALVLGSIESPGGAVIGGEATVVGRMVVSVLGSNSQVATTIRAGSVPPLEQKLSALARVIADLDARESKIKRELSRLAEPGRVLSTDDRASVKQLAMDLKALQEQRTKCQRSQSDLEDRIERIRNVNITVEKMLHAGVRILIGDQGYKISKDLKGPIRIFLDRKGEPVYRIGTRGSSLPLGLISEVNLAAA